MCTLVVNSAQCTQALLDHGADITFHWVQGSSFGTVGQNIFDVIIHNGFKTMMGQPVEPRAIELLIEAGEKAGMQIPDIFRSYLQNF